MSMLGPIGPAASAASVSVSQAESSTPSPGAQGTERRHGATRFAEIAQGHPQWLGPPGAQVTGGPLRPEPPDGVGKELGRILGELRQDERRLDSFYRRATRGGQMDLQELLAMQSLVYRYSQRVDVLSKLVERMTSAVRQTLQTQM